MSNGLNDFATNSELREGLRKDFPSHQLIKVPKAGGHPVDTVSHAIVTDRLNQIAPGWTYEILRFIEVDGIWIKPDVRKKETFEPYNDGQKHLVAVFGSMTIGSVTRYEVGEVDRPSAYGAELKLALSDFIKRAGMRFGVGIGLKSKELAVTADFGESVGDAQGLAEAPTSPGVPASEGRSDPEGSRLTTGVQGSAPSPRASGDEHPQGLEGGDPDAKANTEAFERLLAVCGGNKNKALLRLNRCTGEHFTWESAQGEATRRQLSAAITGEKMEGVA